MKSSNINYDLTQTLQEAWQVKDMFVIFNEMQDGGNILEWRSLLSYEVMWAGSEVYGVITFTDADNYLENLPLSIGGFLSISHTSQPGTKYGKEAKFEKTFVITSVKSADGAAGNTKVVEINFEDMITKKLKSAYESIVYDDMPPSDALSNRYRDLGVKNLVVAANTNEKNTTIITPSHISAHEYTNEENNYRGYNFIQDRHTSYLVHDSHMTNQQAKSTNEIFEYQPADVQSRAQVLEYVTDGFDMKALEASIPTNANAISNESTQGETMDITAGMTTPVGGTISNSIKSTDLLVVTGEKQHAGYNKSNATLSKELKNLQKMSIWVPGWNGNRLGMSVQVEMPRPVHINQSEENEIYKGNWIVNKVRDKIISSYFVQELFLSRAGA